MTPAVAPALVAGATVSALIVVLLLAVGAAHAARGRRESLDDRRRRELTPLVHGLLDDDPDDAVPASVLLDAPAELDEVVLELLPQLRGSDRQVLRDVLAERGVVARAVTDLGARRPWRRGRAVALLGSAADASHLAAMAARLQDRSLEVRCAAARALGKAGDPAAVGYLLDALSAAQALPHGVAGMALLDLGTTALPQLRDALMDDDPDVRSLAAEIVGVHGDIAAAPALEVLLRDPEEDAAVREAAAGALGRIGSPTSTEPLARALTESPALRLQRVSAEALGRIGDPVAAVPLLAGMASPDVAIRTACADALARLGPEGRSWLEEVSAGSGAAAEVARAALDDLAAGARRLQPVGAR
jgi:HEAT repeat protein